MADPEQLFLVFQNLLTNALKFASVGVAPKISVEATLDGDQCHFSVTDNGIGIEPRHRDQIFGMFKRLHTRSEYPGTGIGLALVKKIVERHGGIVGVEDAPEGTGSRFWFTLPAGRG
jgi:signal transduction histidine kinase